MDEQMREKFEKWHAMRYGRAQMERGVAGVYKWNVTEDRWLAWQACAAALSQPAAQGAPDHSAGGECGGVQAWRPIETAPIIQNPLDTRPSRCLVFTKDGGTHMGAVWRYPEGAIGVNVDNVCGDLDGWITHWMPLPVAPKAAP